MPRSLRIEYPGAFYHVINRGNYRDSVFFSDTVKSIFENTLFAARRVQKVFHCNYLIYKDLKPFLTKVVAICPLNHYPLRTMKQKLWITLVTYLAYCIDKELYKAIDYLREQV